MEKEIKIKKHTAETIYISHPEASYGIFCFNDAGDLFLNSDWGMYGYAWRSYGLKSFKDFLAGANADYIVMKFGINYQELAGKKLPKHKSENLLVLVQAFIDQVKLSLEPPTPSEIDDQVTAKYEPFKDDFEDLWDEKERYEIFDNWWISQLRYRTEQAVNLVYPQKQDAGN